ncbi:MAG: hypothetical protein KatS3mg111_1231 [Pirellulaceae bacterium]|nr:MAG: hypothetical protein KatS3mg111_1231 [Pirellulaceae bacterium]
MAHFLHDRISSAFLGAIPEDWRMRVVRRRVLLTLVGITFTCTFNLTILTPLTMDPFAWTQALVWPGWFLLTAGLLLRSWAAGTLNKAREVTSTGPYALCRNPLYLGSLCILLAFCWWCRDWLTVLLAAGPLGYVYGLQVRYEEQLLDAKFGQAWRDYAATVPRLLPRQLPPRAAWAGWTFTRWRRNREYRALGGVALGVLAVWLWQWLHSGGH